MPADVLPRPEKIMALLPCYSEAGDGTEIITADGRREFMKASVTTVIRRLARRNTIDLPALQSRMQQTFHRSQRCVFPLAPGLVLFKVKVRTPRVAGDKTCGYVNVLMTEKVHALPGQPGAAHIDLAGGVTVTSLWSRGTVEEYIAMARLAAQLSPEPPTDPHLARLLATFIHTLLKAANSTQLSG